MNKLLIPVVITKLIIQFLSGIIPIFVILMCLISIKVIFYPWKFLVLMLMKKKNSDMMSPIDARFMKENPVNHYNVIMIQVCDRSCDLKWMKTRFQQLIYPNNNKDVAVLWKRYLMTPQKSAFGYWFWEDTSEEFDINLHCKIPKEIDHEKIITETQLLNFIADIYDQPFPKGRPLWEYLYIPKFKYDKDPCTQKSPDLSVFVGRGNHAYGDGFTLIQTFNTIFEVPFESPINLNPITTFQLCCSIFEGICEFGKYVWNRSSYSVDKSAIHGPKLSGEKIFCLSDHIDFEIVRKIKKKHQVAVYSTFMNMISEAFRTYFRYKQFQIPNSIQMMITVATRVPTANKENDNIMLVWPISVPFGEDTSDIKRLLVSDRRYKDSCKIINVFRLSLKSFTWLLDTLPHSIIHKLLEKPQASSLNMASVPGPPQDDERLENKLYGQTALSMLCSDIGIGFMCVTFKNKFRLTLVVDKTLIPVREDAQLFLKYCEESLNNLLDKEM